MRKTHKERSAFIAAATILSLSCPSSPASAQTPQANAVEHFAQAIVGVRRCARYALNIGLMTIVSMRLGLNLNHPRARKLLDERVAFHTGRVAGRSDADLCVSLARLYGPGGEAVSGLVVMRAR